MANQEHLHILAKGVEAFNGWRFSFDGCSAVPDLSYANLRGIDLSGAHLTYANLHHTDLTGAKLQGAQLREARALQAHLEGADLSNASLSGAVFNGSCLARANLAGAYLSTATFQSADLQGADLRSSDLSRTNFWQANLAGVNFESARLRFTLLIGVDLSETIGLELARHDAPSVIGIDTAYYSKGQIPESFLRGAGIPENFIMYMKSLTGAALDFYSCFISYSTKDQDFADRLHADLQDWGVRCWFAPHDIQGERKIPEQIDEPVRVYDKLLLILSEHSMSSNWVKTKIANARAREEQQKRQMLFPISLAPFDSVRSWKLFDADAGIDSAREIREYHIPDFTNWKDHDSYSKAFERLMRDLKAVDVSIIPSGLNP